MMKNVPEIDTIGEDAYKTTSANVQRRSSVTVQRRTSATGISSKVGVQRKISVTGLTNALARLNEVESVTIDNHQDTPPPPKINQAGSEKKGWLSSFFTTPKPDVKLLQKVGEGKFSNVFRAVHTPTLVDVAVKEVLKYKLTQSEWDLVVCEVNVLKRLGEQPHIASLFEVVMLTEEDTLWMVMELVEGDTLDVWMEKQTPKNKISVEMALDITRQVASALDHCHRNNVAHRDIKPANIMVTTDDDGKVDVKLIDFGFATLDSHVHNTVYCGTPRFAAPELWHRKPYLPAPVDMWALGVLFYYLLSGKLPFRSKRIKANVCAVKFEKLENVSEAISSTLTRMFTVNAAERMTASEFLQLSLLLNEDLTASTLGKEKPQLKHPACNPDLHLHVYDLSYFVVRDDILALMVKMGFNELEVIESVEVGLYNHTAAVYYLLRRSRLLETTFDVMHKPKFNSARFKPNVSTPSMEVLRAPKSAATVDEPTPASRKGSTFSNQFMQDLSMATDNADEDYDEIHVNDINMRSIRDKVSGRAKHRGSFDLSSKRDRALSLTDPVPRVGSRRYISPDLKAPVLPDIAAEMLSGHPTPAPTPTPSSHLNSTETFAFEAQSALNVGRTVTHTSVHVNMPGYGDAQNGHGQASKSVTAPSTPRNHGQDQCVRTSSGGNLALPSSSQSAASSHGSRGIDAGLRRKSVPSVSLPILEDESTSVSVQENYTSPATPRKKSGGFGSFMWWGGRDNKGKAKHNEKGGDPTTEKGEKRTKTQSTVHETDEMDKESSVNHDCNAVDSNDSGNPGRHFCNSTLKQTPGDGNSTSSNSQREVGEESHTRCEYSNSSTEIGVVSDTSALSSGRRRRASTNAQMALKEMISHTGEDKKTVAHSQSLDYLQAFDAADPNTRSSPTADEFVAPAPYSRSFESHVKKGHPRGSISSVISNGDLMADMGVEILPQPQRAQITGPARRRRSSRIIITVDGTASRENVGNMPSIAHG